MTIQAPMSLPLSSNPSHPTGTPLLAQLIPRKFLAHAKFHTALFGNFYISTYADAPNQHSPIFLTHKAQQISQLRHSCFSRKPFCSVTKHTHNANQPAHFRHGTDIAPLDSAAFYGLNRVHNFQAPHQQVCRAVN